VAMDRGRDRDQWAAALGYVVMSAADVEYQVAGLVQYVLGERDEVLARKHWAAQVRVLKESLARAATMEPQLAPLVERFEVLTGYRNALVHGLWSGPDEAGDMTVVKPERAAKSGPVDLSVLVTRVSLDDLEAVRADLSRLAVDVEFTWAALKDPRSVGRSETGRAWRAPTWVPPSARDAGRDETSPVLDV
jgi:hypothetical protein